MEINGVVKTFNRLASIKKVLGESNKQKDCKDNAWFFDGTFSPNHEDLLSNRLREHKYMGEEYQRIMYDTCIKQYTNRPFDINRDMFKPSIMVLAKRWFKTLNFKGNR
jgi:hypothetical protein